MRALLRLLPPIVAALALGAVATEWPALMRVLEVPAETRLFRWGDALTATFFALACAWAINRALNVLVWQGLMRGPGEPPLPRLLVDLVGALIYLTALALVGEGHFGVDVMTGALATSGLVVAIVGFAVRDVIADIFSGVTAQFERPYAIGDWIEFQGKVGQVVEVSWRATRLMTQEEVTVVVPNGLLARTAFLNYSLPRRYFRDTFKVRLDPSVPTDRARRILLAAARSAEGVRVTPAPDIKLIEFERQAAVYHVRFWVDDYPALNPARDAVACAVLDYLDKAGLDFAREGSDVTLHRDTPAQHRNGPEHMLRRVDLFDVLEDQDIAELVAGLKVRRAKTGEAIVREGESGASLFVLSEGLVEVEAKDAQGVSRSLARLVPGGVFGEISLLTGHPRSATVIARTDALLYEITAEILTPLLQRRPKLAEELSAIVAGRLRRNAALAQAVVGDSPHEAERPLTDRILDRMRDFFRL